MSTFGFLRLFISFIEAQRQFKTGTHKIKLRKSNNKGLGPRKVRINNVDSAWREGRKNVIGFNLTLSSLAAKVKKGAG